MSDEVQDWKTGSIKIRILGKPLEMEMTVPANPVKPQRMLPVFQMMSNEFVGISEELLEKEGKKISCKAGCGACCRQPVPIAEIEARGLAELVENLPEQRRNVIKERFALACEKLRGIKWFERFDKIAELNLDEKQELVMEYFYQGIPCPFLEEESCSIHAGRPLSCREYLVTSPAEKCKDPKKNKIEGVPILVKPSAVLREISRANRSGAVNFVIMVRALEWVEEFPDNSEEKPGEQWAQEFFRILSTMKKSADAERFI
jgi:Fe-S-cluster containining protein